jgi:ribosomal protein L23
VDSDFNKTSIKNAIDKISDFENCLSVRVLNVRPRAHASKTKKSLVNYKLKGKTVNERKKKVFATLRDVAKFIGGLNK